MAVALSVHDELIRSVVAARGGVAFKHTGDGMCVVFTSASAAVAAAVEVQAGVGLPVRMGLHTGEAESCGGDYFGPTLVNRAARVMDAGHGGQVLVSSATAGLLAGVDLVDLGPPVANYAYHQIDEARAATEGRLEVDLTFVPLVPGQLARVS